MTLRPLALREWFLLIALVMLAEYNIISFVHGNAGDPGVLSQISLGSAIASIFLALVAIIIALLQGSDQASSTKQVTTSLAELTLVTRGLQETHKSLNVETTALGELVKQQQALREEVVSHGEKVLKLDAAFAKISEQLQEKLSPLAQDPKPQSQPSPASDTDNAKDILIKIQMGNALVFVASYAIFTLRGKDLTIANARKYYYEPVGKADGDPQGTDLAFAGIILGIAQTLLSLGVITNTRPITFPDDAVRSWTEVFDQFKTMPSFQKIAAVAAEG